VNSATSPSADELLARRPGTTPPSSQARSHSFLSDALVARGLVSEEVVEAALAASRDGRPYGEILIEDGSIAEVDFARAMADHHGVDHVDLDVFDIDPLATALVAREIARRNGAVPIAVLVTGEVVVAIHDPALTNLVEIADVTGSRIRAVIASRSQIENHLDGALRPAAPAPGVRARAAASRRDAADAGASRARARDHAGRPRSRAGGRDRAGPFAARSSRALPIIARLPVGRAPVRFSTPRPLSGSGHTRPTSTRARSRGRETKGE
jgi:hypothetical protein